MSDEEEFVYSDEEEDDVVDLELSAGPGIAVGQKGSSIQFASPPPPPQSLLKPPSSPVRNPEYMKSTPSLSLSAPIKEKEYEVLSKEDLKDKQDLVVHDVSDVLTVDSGVSALLLLHFQWSRETLLDAYYSNPEKARIESGATVTTDMLLKASKSSKKGASAKQLFMCPVLFEEFPLDETFAMGCSTKEHPEEHRFSLIAWREYLKAKVSEGSTAIFSTCPMDGCQSIIPPSVWYGILAPNPKNPVENDNQYTEVLRKYEKYLLHSFVDMNKSIKWCPTPDCEHAVYAHGSVGDVLCSNCRNKFCFKCNLEAHLPINCKMLEIWVEKCQNESETANWILANTKSCPKCNVRIEKNQGCNHMKCSKCQYEFCWVCMGDWVAHNNDTGGYYNCNKFKPESEESTSKDQKVRAKQELDRYLHYYQRYSGHDQSGKFARKQLKQAELKMEEIQTGKGSGWVEVQFLGDAVRQLIENRRVLKYTYVLAYYLPYGPAKTLFEHNQSDLEKYTEQLSELTEKPWDQIVKSDVTNKMRVTKKFLTRIVEAVDKEGLVDLAMDEMFRNSNEDEVVEGADQKTKRSVKSKRK